MSADQAIFNCHASRANMFPSGEVLPIKELNPVRSVLISYLPVFGNIISCGSHYRLHRCNRVCAEGYTSKKYKTRFENIFYHSLFLPESYSNLKPFPLFYT